MYVVKKKKKMFNSRKYQIENSEWMKIVLSVDEESW